MPSGIATVSQSDSHRNPLMQPTRLFADLNRSLQTRDGALLKSASSIAGRGSLQGDRRGPLMSAPDHTDRGPRISRMSPEVYTEFEVGTRPVLTVCVSRVSQHGWTRLLPDAARVSKPVVRSLSVRTSTDARDARRTSGLG